MKYLPCVTKQAARIRQNKTYWTSVIINQERVTGGGSWNKLLLLYSSIQGLIEYKQNVQGLNIINNGGVN